MFLFFLPAQPQKNNNNLESGGQRGWDWGFPALPRQHLDVNFDGGRMASPNFHIPGANSIICSIRLSYSQNEPDNLFDPNPILPKGSR